MFDTNNIPSVSGKGILKWGGFAVAGISAAILISNAYFKVEDGKFAVYQNTLTGAKSVVHGPSASFRIPGFSMDTHYKYSTTLDFDDKAVQSGKTLASSINPAIDVRFADTYVGKIPMSARLDIPRNDEAILKIHSSFRSYDNLVDKLMEKTLKDVAVNTATQYTGEEFFQGALNDFKTAILDQANNGIIKTKRIKVEDDTAVATTVGVGGDKSKGGTSKKKNMVWRTVPQLENGKLVRIENPLEQYGVTVTQINIGNPIPESRLDTLLGKKKELVAKKIEITQRQENAKAEAETAKLEGETARIKAEQKQLMAADAEVIARKKEVQLAGLQAQKEKVDKEKEAALAKIEKQKELDIAKANKGIQEANAIAAKYEAQAIKEKGLAEAAVEKAKYAAKDPKLYALEKQVEITANLGTALNGITVNMPTNMVTNGDGKHSTSSVDTVMSLIQVDKLNELADAAKTKK
jgi:hypothetical protein